MKNVTELVSAVAIREGKKHQASISDVREIFGHLTDICAENAEAYGIFAAQVAKKVKKPSGEVGLAKKKASKKKVAKKKVAKKAKKK